MQVEHSSKQNASESERLRALHQLMDSAATTPSPSLYDPSQICHRYVEMLDMVTFKIMLFRTGTSGSIKGHIASKNVVRTRNMGPSESTAGKVTIRERFSQIAIALTRSLR